MVYIEREKYLNNEEYLDEDLIGFSVYCNQKLVGNVSNILRINDNKKLIEIDSKLIPFELIIDINLENKSIFINYLEGLI